MFTGLIENLGVIVSRQSSGGAGKIFIRLKRPFEKLVHGESIAVNGCCLTLESEQESGMVIGCHTLEETLDKTNLGSLPVGAPVNLERALRLGDRLGGHIVSGHIDGTGTVLGMTKKGGDIEYRVSAPPELLAFLVPKGSIAIDGVSLTLVEVGSDSFTAHLIPVTLTDTALGARKTGAPVNLETDLIGKYVLSAIARQSAGAPPKSNVTMDTLREAGFL